MAEDPDFDKQKSNESSFNDSYFTIGTIFNNLFFENHNMSIDDTNQKPVPNVKLPKIFFAFIQWKLQGLDNILRYFQ